MGRGVVRFATFFLVAFATAILCLGCQQQTSQRFSASNPVVDPTSTASGTSGVAYQTDLTATSQWIASHSTLPDGAILYGSDKIIPYYGNIAALGWTKDPTRDSAVQAWMQWYLNHLNWPDQWELYGTVYDYNVSGSTETSTGNADSTDAYAATFLSLAWALYSTGDPSAQAYVKSLEYQLDIIGGVIVLTQQNDGLTWAKPNYQIKYLMDNCEAYRGLRDLALLFQYAFNDSAKQAYYRLACNHSVRNSVRPNHRCIGRNGIRHQQPILKDDKHLAESRT